MRKSALLFFLYTASLSQARPANAAASVTSIGGNIFLIEPGARAEQLTWSGTDSQPAISPDGEKVAFVRLAGHGQLDDVRLIYLSQRRVRTPSSIVALDLSRDTEIGTISDPQFSPDSSAVYFFTRPGNLGLIVRSELAPPKSYIVARGALPIAHGRSFDVIAQGKYAGDLIVYKDSGKLTAGPLFLYWLTDPFGASLAIVADKESDVDQFRSDIALGPSN